MDKDNLERVHYVYYVHIIFVHLLKLSYLIDLIGLLVLVDAIPGQHLMNTSPRRTDQTFGAPISFNSAQHFCSMHFFKLPESLIRVCSSWRII